MIKYYTFYFPLAYYLTYKSKEEDVYIVFVSFKSNVG